MSTFTLQPGLEQISGRLGCSPEANGSSETPLGRVRSKCAPTIEAALLELAHIAKTSPTTRQ
jgi:hypothetical protein